MVSFGKFYVKIDVCHQNEDMYEVGFLKHVGFREILAKCNFFLSNKKTTLGPRQLGPVCSDLLHKNNFGSFSFFLPRKHFLLKTPCDFRPFLPRKRVAFLPRTLKIRSNGFFDLDFLETGPLL